MINTAFLILVTTLTNIVPLGLPWEKIHQHHPDISGYSYYYGDLDWGQVIYLGREDIAGMETELQIYFLRGRLTKAILILGPRGINDYNCIKKYKRIKKLVTYKYGKYNFIKEEKDPIIEDLIYSSECYPVSLGIYSVSTYWTKGDFQIESTLVADSDGYYIEISYVYLNLDRDRKKHESKLLLRKL